LIAFLVVKKAKKLSITEAHISCARMMLFYYAHDVDARKKLNIRQLCSERFLLAPSTQFRPSQ
jgi:hypothetical protein